LAQVRGPLPAAPDRELSPTLIRSGGDALLVTSGIMTERAQGAARVLERDGLDVAILNLPAVAPAPVTAVLEAVAEHRVVVFVEESRAAGSPSASLMAALLDRRREVVTTLICTPPVPMPFALGLLDDVVPTSARIAAAVRQLAERRGCP